MANGHQTALPPNVLERADVRDALVRHDFGQVFILARKWGGVSFMKIGDACQIKPERVGKIARGEASITSFEKICDITDGLRIPGHLVGLAPRDWEASESAPQTLSPQQADSPVSIDSDLGPWEVADLARRMHATSLDPEEVETTMFAVDRLCRAYPYMPAKHLHRQTRLGIRHVTELMNSRLSLKQHRELMVAAGWLFLLGGCLEYDMGQREAADISCSTARRIGHEAGHGEITAWSFELGAWFALTQGRYNEILECVEAGHRSDKARSVGVQLYAHAAKAYARLGNTNQVRDALDAGRARLERLPRPEHRDHHFVIDPDKWDFYEMDAYRMLGDDERASTHANEVIRLGTAPDGTENYPMRVAEARLTLGVTSARSGELEEAVTHARRALGTSRKSLPSLLVVTGELSEELNHNFPRESLAEELQEQIRDIASSTRPALDSD